MIKINISMSLGKEKNAKGLTVRELIDGARKEALNKKAAGRFSTASNYITVVNSLLTFVKDSKWAEHKPITANLLTEYEQWLLARKVCQNTVACYFRSLRAIYNCVLESKGKGLSKHQDLFDGFSTKPCSTNKRSVNIEDIKKLKSLSIKDLPSMQLAKDIFLFSFYCMGMPFVDVAFLKKENITDNSIVYFRRKTGRRICVPLEACIQQIIQRYQESDTPFVFPLLTASGGEAQYKEYRMKMRWYNNKLKQLSSLAGIYPSLSSYVSRHTWASMAFSKNVGINIISQALGHASTKITSIYIKELHPTQLKDANRLVLSMV